MRHEPTAAELTYLEDMDPAQRLHYFISRTMESEEIWRLCDASDWVSRDHNGKAVMPIWPYRGLAEPFAAKGEATDAVSLEHFVFHELNELHGEGIRVEILPGKLPGVLMSAGELFHILEHKLDEEQYFLEG